MIFSDKQVTKWIELAKNGVNTPPDDPRSNFKHTLLIAKAAVDRHGDFVSDIFFNPSDKDYVESSLGPGNQIWGAKLHYTNACPINIGLAISCPRDFKETDPEFNSEYVNTFLVK